MSEDSDPPFEPDELEEFLRKSGLELVRQVPPLQSYYRVTAEKNKGLERLRAFKVIQGGRK